MVFMAMITSAEGEVSPSENIEEVDGEISIAFWSFAFVLLLIVTVWFYITQIGPMRRSAVQVEEIDKEEEVAKRILEHLSNDLRFKNDNSEEESLQSASQVRIVKEEDSSVYEYIDDEIHIHYSQYAWDDENCDQTDFPVALGAARRRSMENMDLIFPGVLPSIIEEEEFDGETDTESSEKSQDTDVDGIQDDESFANLPSVYKPIVNNNGGSIESSVNKRYNYTEKDANIVISMEESHPKYSDTKQDRVIAGEHAEKHYSRYMSENVNNALNVKSLLEALETDQNDTSLLSRQTDNGPQVLDTENSKNISSDVIRHSETQESVIPAKCQTVAEFTSGGFDSSSDKNDKLSMIQDIPIKLHDDVIERTSMFTLSSCDLEPSFKQDANEIENENEVLKLCASNTQKISCPAENGLDQHSTRDFPSKYATNEEHGHDNIEKELFPELNCAPMEDTRGLAGIDVDTNKRQAGEIQVNGFGDDIADSNEHTTHAWTFFSMSGTDETTAPEKGMPTEKDPSRQVDIPTIIIDSYDEVLQGDKSIVNEDSFAAMNGHENTLRYGDSFETDIDIDDIDLIDSDEIDNEGELSIYFQRHVSVTDLDKILLEEGQTDANGDSSKVLETDLTVEEPYLAETDFGMSRTSTEISQDAETNKSTHVASETTYIEDESDMNIQQPVVVSTRLSDCLDKLVSNEDFDETDSWTDKSYTVESLFDDLSFQKDGVYGELVLSQLNESHNNKADESFSEPYSDDWYGFSEELRRERKPFLFTIPEDEEIGLAEVSHENCFRGTSDSHIYDNEIIATKETGQEALLKAPIATMETYDSDFDLDENEESSRSDNENDMGETVEDEQQRSPETDLSDNVTLHNGLTENNGTDGDTAKDKTKTSDCTHHGSIENNGIYRDPVKDKNATPESTHNGVTENSANVNDTEVVDNTRPVKIVKKIKIFVRKEIKIATDDSDLLEGFVVKPGQLIEDPAEKEKTRVLNEVQKENIILACRECKTHHPYEVFKSEVAPDNQIIEPLNYQDEKCDISQVNAKNMEVIRKREAYVPDKPEPTSVTAPIDPKRDMMQDFAKLPAKEIKVDLERKIEAEFIVPRVPTVESEVPESDIPRGYTQATVQDDQTKLNGELESRFIADTLDESRIAPVEVLSPESDFTRLVPAQDDQLKINAELEMEARLQTVEADARECDNRQDVTKLPVQKENVNIIPKPESKTVEMRLSKIDNTKRFPQPAVQNDQIKVNDEPESNIAGKPIKARVSPVEVHAQEKDTSPPFTQVSAQDDKATTKAAPERKVVAKAIETRVSPVKAKLPENDYTRVLAQLPTQDDKTKTNVVKEEITRTDTKLDVHAALDTSKVRSKISVSAKASREDPLRDAEHTTIAKSAQELPSVKISVQGKDSQDGREHRHVRSPRVSPTPWEKRPRKTYLSSCNIRLTKSHEDLRFAERVPEEPQESIKEEEPPDVQSPQSERSQTPTNLDLQRLVSEDDAFESIEPASIHTAKITVQEVIGDRQRIVILNVKKKVHGKARWKSLNDLDSIKMALTPPRRTSDLGIGMTSFAEEEEKAEETENKDRTEAFTSKVVPVVQIKSRQDRKSLPDVSQPCKSPTVKVTALQNQEPVSEQGAENKIPKASETPVLQGKPLQNGHPLTEIKHQSTSPHKLPVIRATALENREFLTESGGKTKIIKATVTSALQDRPPSEPVAEDKETKPEFKARVSQISPKDKGDGKDRYPPKRVTRVHDISQVVDVIPRLERETVTEITDESTKGNSVKVHVSQRIPTPEMEENFIRPHSSPAVADTPKRDGQIEAGESQTSTTVEVRQRQGRESGYGSLGVSPNLPPTSARVNHVFVLEGANERSVSSLSSIEDMEDAETLGESRVMVTDLDALLARQDAPQSEATSPTRTSIESPEVKEKVRVLARMEPVPEKIVRINKDEDSLVIRHVKHEEPIVVEPIIVADAAGQDESHLISAFLVNDGYDDDELDEVFFEEYTPYGEPESADNSYRTHSSDADSETSSVNSLPLKHRHRQTRAALEAANPGVRNRTESSGSSKTTTPVAELENEKAPTSSGSSTPESKAHEISRDESFSYKAPDPSRPTDIKKTTEYSSAFTSVSRTADARRPRARSHGHNSDEESIVKNKGLGASFQDVKTLPGLQIDNERFKQAADSRKSMPDLSARKEPPMDDSPYLRGLSAHTRRWLSQNVWMDSNEQQDEQDLMTSDLFLYPSNRFQPGSNIDASFLSLANERDFPDDVSVSTLSTRPQSPMSEFSFAGETPYWGLRRGSTTVIKCSNPRCEREEVLFGGEKTTYTSCPACFTYYCSRSCRRVHWSEHKKVCFFGRINSYIRSFIYLCHKKEVLKYQLSKTAKDGHKKKGRGSVMVTFASAQSARKFMTTGCTFFPSPPTYSSLVDLQAEGVISKHKVALMQHIKDYEPEEEFVLNLAIIAGKMENLPANPVPRRKVNTVLQVIKIPLSSKLKETSPKPALPNDPNTETKVFYLPKCARHEFVNENEARRHYCRNISKNLKQYGIRLKHDYPDVYEKLCLYVDQNVRFTEPLTVYGNQGKKIVMCKIMPETGDEEKKA